MARDLLREQLMFMHVALLSLLSTANLALPTSHEPDRTKVEVWTSRGEDPYTAGQAVRVLFRADQDAYVTLLRVDTDGRVYVLFPRQPWEDNFARGGRVYEVPGATASHAFLADDDPGEGYLFAVASAEPFTYDAIESAERWDYQLIADGGRVRGDPYTALTDLAERIVPQGDDAWDYDIAPYYVQHHYDYPRFLCYDCHTNVSFRTWNPYDYSCVRFRIVVYDDPYYYPYRSYGGTRVVFTRPYRPEPRFIFKDRRGSDAFLTRVRARPVNDNRRRDVGVRGRDLGHPGTVPAPTAAPTRREPRSWGSPFNRPVRPADRETPATPSRPARPTRPDQGGVDRPTRPEHPEHPDRPSRGGGRDRPDQGRPAPARQPATRGPDARRAPPAAAPAGPRQSPRAEPKRDAPKRDEPQLRRRRS